MTTSQETGKGTPFTTLLASRPTLHQKLEDKLADLVAAVVETGKKGTITLALNVAPFEGSTDTLVVSDRLTVKRPEVEQKPSILYPTPDGDLRRSDPNQPEFELIGLDKETR
ncbi:MAG: hypothetical protein ACTH31_08890 [Pseudoclavibacter sp.]